MGKKKSTDSKSTIEDIGEKAKATVEQIEELKKVRDKSEDKIIVIEDKEEIKKNSKKKLIRNAIIFTILIILTYYFIFKKIDRKGIQEAIKYTNIWFLLVAIILASGNIIFEAINHYRTLNTLGEKITFKQALKYGIVGFFFSAITPAASGGQPVQIVYMHRDNIKYTNATITILLQSFAYLTMMAVLGLVGYIINYNYVSNLGFIEYFFFIGIMVNAVIVIVTLFAMFSKKASQKTINFVYKIFKAINEEKANKFKNKIDIQLKEYHDSAKAVVNNRGLMIKTFLTSTLQLISYHSVCYFVYLALGIKHLGYITVTSLQSFLYLSVSVLPLPGTVGVNETGFSLLYNPVIPKNYVDSAMLLSRGISFYLFVIITGLILLVLTIRKKNATK